ncbi:MAG: Flagellar FliJ protein [Bacilli bacterium]|nr:Flagellar FliJ protein [Bacilli bacterium]
MSISYDSLDRIKALKSRIKQLAEMSYADAIERQKLAEDELARLLSALLQLDDDRGVSQVNTRLSVQEMQDWERYRRALAAALSRQQDVVTREEDNARLHQVNLTNCFQDEKIWEHLLQKKVTLQGLQEKRAEQAALDEAAISRFNRG